MLDLKNIESNLNDVKDNLKKRGFDVSEIDEIVVLNTSRKELTSKTESTQAEIKKLSKDQIIKNIDKFKKDLFNFRFQKMNSQITNPAKISETKKTIARLKTTLKGKLNA